MPYREIKMFVLTTIQNTPMHPVNRMQNSLMFNLVVSAVGIEIRYGLDVPGIESRWGEVFRTLPDRSWGPPGLLYKRYRVFHGGKVAGAWRCSPTPI